MYVMRVGLKVGGGKLVGWVEYGDNFIFHSRIRRFIIHVLNAYRENVSAVNLKLFIYFDVDFVLGARGHHYLCGWERGGGLQSKTDHYSAMGCVIELSCIRISYV